MHYSCLFRARKILAIYNKQNSKKRRVSKNTCPSVFPGRQKRQIKILSPFSLKKQNEKRRTFKPDGATTGRGSSLQLHERAHLVGIQLFDLAGIAIGYERPIELHADTDLARLDGPLLGQQVKAADALV